MLRLPLHCGLLVRIVALSLAVFFSQTSSVTAETGLTPENAHSIGVGSRWQCDAGFRLSDGVCEPVVIPDNARASGKSYGSGWECLRGYRLMGSAKCQKVEVPENAYLAPNGERWICDRGFRKLGVACMAIPSPEHSYLSSDSGTSGWLCERGYEKAEDLCAPIAVPENGYLTNKSYGKAWACERGFQARGDQCLPVFVPANAYLDDSSFSRGWKCLRGYKAGRDECKIVEVPEAAHLNHAGDGWECDRAFQRRDGACVRAN